MAFLVDATQHLNIPNKVLQGKRMLVTEYCHSVCVFKLKCPSGREQLENEFTFFASPFTVNATDMPADMQLGLIDLQSDSTLKQKFATEG